MFTLRFHHNPLKEALLAALVVFVTTLCCNVAVAFIAKKALLESLQHHLMEIGNFAAATIDGDLHQTITSPEQKGSEAYVNTLKPFDLIKETFKDVVFIYTVVLRDDQPAFVVDSQYSDQFENRQYNNSITRDTSADVFEVYDSASPQMLEALKDKKQTVEDKVYTDDWGQFLSSYTPFYDGKGNFIGTIGVDIDAEGYNAHMRGLWIALGIGILLALLLSVCVFIIVHAIRKEHAREHAARLQRFNLMRDFNGEIEKFAAKIHEVSEAINTEARLIAGLTSSTAEDTVKAKSLINGAAGRIGSIGLICHELLETAASIENNALSAEHTSMDAVTQLRSMDAAARELTSASENISQVVTLITDVTEKIDLLALNATIEAARAGEAGKGFTVVANEVKALSQQTAKATHRIAEYVENIQQAVSVVVQAFEGISGKITNISEQTAQSSSVINQQRDLVRDIASDVENVKEGAATVERTVSQVSGHAQNTHEQIDRLYSSTQILVQLNQGLKNNVSRFLKDIDMTSSQLQKKNKSS